MVGLMHRFIKVTMVDEAMEVISDNLPNKGAEYDVSYDLGDGGQGRVETMCWWSTGELIKSNNAQLQGS